METLALGWQTDAVFHAAGQQERMTRSPFTDPLERLLRDGAADGTLRRHEPREYATVVFNLVGWTTFHRRARHSWRSDRARALRSTSPCGAWSACEERAGSG